MRKNLLRGIMVGVYAFLGLLSGRLEADPWYSEKGLASHEVQVGAFEDGEEAQRLLSQVEPWFEEAYIAPREGPAGEYYRVRIGPFKTKADVQQIANSLKRAGHRVFLDEVPESALVKDGTP